MKLWNNFGLKLSALALAMVIWWMMQEELITTKDVKDIPLEVSIPTEMVVINKESLNMDVQLSGPKDVLDNLNRSNIQASFTLPETTEPGTFTFLLDKSIFDLPKSVKVLRIHPMQIILVLDEQFSKKLMVKPTFYGKPKEGFRIAETIARPSLIEMSGAKSELAKRESIETLPIDFNNYGTDFIQRVKLVRLKTVEEDFFVDVFVRIEKELEKREFRDLSIFVLQESKKKLAAQLKPSKVSIYLEGPKLVLANLLPEKIQVFVDISGLIPGDYELPILVNTPEEVKMVDYAPKVVKVNIQSITEAV